MIITGSDNYIKINDKHTGYTTALLRGHCSPVNILHMIDDHILISGSIDGILKVWNVKTRMCISTLIGHKVPVKSIVASGENQIYSGDANGDIHVWHPNLDLYDQKHEICKPKQILRGHTQNVLSLTVDKSNNVYSASSDKTLRKWSCEGINIKTVTVDTKITTMSLTKSDSLMFFGSENGEIFI